MSVAYRSVSAIQRGTSISVSLPTGYQANDLLILMLCGYNMTQQSISGWTNLSYVNTLDRKYQILYKISAASESAVAVSSANYMVGAMAAFSGANTTTPIDSYNTGTSSGTSQSTPTLTTTSADCMYICSTGFTDGSTSTSDTSNYSSWANSDLVSITERLDGWYYVSGDTYSKTGLAFASGIKTTAGAIKATTATADVSSNASAWIVFAIAPAISVDGNATEMTATATTIDPTVAIVYDYEKTLTASVELSTTFTRGKITELWVYPTSYNDYNNLFTDEGNVYADDGSYCVTTPAYLSTNHQMNYFFPECEIPETAELISVVLQVKWKASNSSALLSSNIQLGYDIINGGVRGTLSTDVASNNSDRTQTCTTTGTWTIAELNDGNAYCTINGYRANLIFSGTCSWDYVALIITYLEPITSPVTTIYVNIGGTYKTGVVYVKINGAWIEADSISEKIDGIWV